MNDKGTCTIRINVVDFEVIENIATVRRNLSSSNGDATDRIGVAERPADFVDAVNGLLDQAIAGQPSEVIPIADLPFDIAHAGGTRGCGRHRLDRTGVIRGVVTQEVPDSAIQYEFHWIARVVGITPAKSGNE